MEVSYFVYLNFKFQNFQGNRDRNTENKNIIWDGILTRWLRFKGKTSHNKFCTRTEVYGVKQKPGKITILVLRFSFGQ